MSLLGSRRGDGDKNKNIVITKKNIIKLVMESPP